MTTEPIVSILGFRVRLSTFKVLQGMSVAVAVLGALLCYLFLRAQEYWLYRHAWWILVCVACGEAIETVFVIRRAEKEE